ncbi:MAG: metallophosphoesterase [Isosphaeraceae bacterium]|nr:metallophosphoesterase [Isosphaeraceae bacterium]
MPTLMGLLWGLGLAVGHVAFCIWAVNVSHALGLGERLMNRITVVVFAVLGLMTVGLAGLVVFVPFRDWPWFAQSYELVCLAIACFGVPLSLVLGLLPKVPEGQTKVASEETLDLPATDPAGAEGFIGPAKRAWMLRMPGNESLFLHKIVWDFSLPTLPAAADGLTILHISDTHFSPVYDRRWFERVAEETAHWGEFDLVLFTGDLLDHEVGLEWVEPVFSRFQARLGRFAILGNHDVPHRPGRVRKALRSAGYTVIDGRWVTVELPGSDAKIAIGGTSAPWGPRLERKRRPDADFTIVLSHTPDQMPRKSSWGGVDLILAGHNHGGQIRLPWLGPILMPSRYSRRFDKGVFSAKGTIMHVSPGVGGKHPIRYGCPPEVALLRLTRASTPALTA